MNRSRISAVLLGSVLWLAGCDLVDSGLAPSSGGGSGSSASATVQSAGGLPTTTQGNGVSNQLYLSGSSGAASATQVGTAGLQHYYSGVSTPLSPIQQQQLMIYRDQLEAQRQALQLQQYRGTSGPMLPIDPVHPGVTRTNPAVVSQNLSQTQLELNRVNSLLNAPVASPTYSPAPLSGTSTVAPPGFSSLGAGAPPVLK